MADKPPFDPSKPFEAADKPKFDPSKPFEAAGANPEPAMTPLESGISGLSQGLTFGFGDEIIGGVKAAGAKLLGNEKPIGDLYREYQTEQEQHALKATKDNPKSYLAGNVAGAVGTALIPGVAPVRGASLAANVGKAVAVGAAYGAGSSTEKPLEQPQEFAKDVLGGAVIGGVSQYGLDKVGKVLGKFSPEALKDFAGRRAFIATGPSAAERKAVEKAGTMAATGQELLDKKIVTVGATLSDIAERAAQTAEDSGKVIGDAVSQVDDLVKSVKASVPDKNLAAALDKRYQFNKERIADKIDQRLIDPNKANDLLDGEVAKLQKLSDKFRAGGTVPLEVGQAIKTSQRKLTKFSSDSVPDAFKADVYDIIKEEMNDVVSKTAELTTLSKAHPDAVNEFAKYLAMGREPAKNASPQEKFLSAFKDEMDSELFSKPAQTGDEILDKYKMANRSYAIAAQALKSARNKMGLEAGQRQFSLTDYLSAMAGFSAGGLPTAGIFAVLNKISRQYGPSSQAAIANALADAIKASPDVLQNVSKTAYNALTSGGLSTGTNRLFQESIQQQSRQGLSLPKQNGLNLPGR